MPDIERAPLEVIEHTTRIGSTVRLEVEPVDAERVRIIQYERKRGDRYVRVPEEERHVVRRDQLPRALVAEPIEDAVVEAVVEPIEAEPAPAQPLLGLHVAPTVAMSRGRSWVEQCARCGCLVAVASSPLLAPVTQLGSCPCCGGTEWWRQRVPVGPFHAAWAPHLIEFVQKIASGGGELAEQARAELERAGTHCRENAVWTGSLHHVDEFEEVT